MPSRCDICGKSSEESEFCLIHKHGWKMLNAHASPVKVVMRTVFVCDVCLKHKQEWMPIDGFLYRDDAGKITATNRDGIISSVSR